MVTRMIMENVLVVIRLNKSILYTTNYPLEIKKECSIKVQYQKMCVCFLLSRANKSFKLVYLSVIRFMLNIFAMALILEGTQQICHFIIESKVVIDINGGSVGK